MPHSIDKIGSQLIRQNLSIVTTCITYFGLQTNIAK